MQYFDILPKIVKTDSSGNSILMTNLMARVSIIPEILNNPLLYYEYSVQDGDTPEIVAYKYYGDSYRYWVVLFANQLLDPQWDWPLSSNDFEAFIVDKYQDFNPYSTVHHYEKTITQFDATTQKTTTKKIIIDEDDYNILVTGTTSYNLPTGSVTVTVSKAAISYYDYELNLNESKRNIKILNSAYVGEMEDQFSNLMTVA